MTKLEKPKKGLLSKIKFPHVKLPKMFETFTKLWVSVLLVAGIIDLQLSYVLAFLGKDQIAETLSIAVVTEILGVSVAYIIRAYFDTKSEETFHLDHRKLDIEEEGGCSCEVPESEENEG